MSLFDNLMIDEDTQRIKEKPFHTIQDKGDEEILKWLNDTVQANLKQHASRYHLMRSNLAAYRGITYRQTHSRSTYRQTERIPTNRTERFVINHLYDMTETRVAQMTRLKPAIQVLPTNDEHLDKNAARACKMLLDHIWYLTEFDSIRQQIHRHKKIFGETFLYVDWDADKGDKHPEAGMFSDEGRQVPENLKTGDVCLDIEVPWRVLIQRAGTFEKAEWSVRIKIEHTDNLKKEYPGKANKIKPEDDSFVFDYSALKDKPLKDDAIVYEFTHKKTKHSPEGAFIKFTKDVILEKSDHKFSHGCHPFVRLTDLDIPDILHGVSQYEMVKPIQNMHNNISTLLAKNIYMMGHAKYVMPKGACKIESLGNDNTVVQYQGAIAPQMMQTQPNPPEAYAFRDKLRDEMGQIYSVHGVSRGEPPKGVTAGVAMQFLNEQEAERGSTEIAKDLRFIREVAKKVLSVAGDYYEPEDGRLIRVFGKNNKYLIESFDSANLHKPYDVRVENSSSIADSKAGKTQRIIEVIQYKPDALSPEQLIELLDLGHYDKTINLITAAVRAAESEVEDILSGKPVADPEPWEDYITQWRVKLKAMQSRDFKEKVPPKYREALKENVMMLEFLMWEKAAENPTFQQQLAQLSLFPLFYRPGQPAPMSKEQQEAVVQGQANRGEPMTAQIGASDPNPLPGEPEQGE